MEKETKFITSDLKTASFLLSKNIQLADVDQVTHKTRFIFNNNPEVSSLLKSYLAGTATVNAQRLFDSYDRLKDVIFSDYKLP